MSPEARARQIIAVKVAELNQPRPRNPELERKAAAFDRWAQ